MTWLKRFRALYGTGPLHLLALVASFAIAGAAVVGWFQRPRDVGTVLEWFAAAILLHDLVLLPLYSLIDRVAFGRRRSGTDDARGTALAGVVNATPYLRIPAILSGLLLVVFFPVIFGLGRRAELNASGIAETGYLARWLVATGVMFAASGVAYSVALARARARSQPPDPAPAQRPPDHDSLAPTVQSAVDCEPTPDPEASHPARAQTAADPAPAPPTPDHDPPAPPVQTAVHPAQPQTTSDPDSPAPAPD